MITTIFFDLDGVLTQEFNGSGTTCANLCASLPTLSYEKVLDCYKAHCSALMTEPKTYSDVWEDFCACVGQIVPIALLPSALRTVTLNEEMWAFARSLHPTYKLGIITDNSVERIPLLEEDLHLSSLFDPIIVSASVRASKHDGTTTIFDAALKEANCKPHEALFIDNQKRNLVTAQSMGMRTYWHDDAINDVAALCSAFDQHLKNLHSKIVDT